MTHKQSFPDVLTKSSQSKTMYVDISKIVVGYSNNILKIPALGSCLGLVIYPRKIVHPDRVAVMGHIMLPDSQKKRNFGAQKKKYPPAKYSDQAVPAMISELENLGFFRKDLDAKMVGGAKMFSSTSDVLDIGKENTRVTTKLLQKFKIPLVKQLTGGDRGMKVRFNVKNYELFVTPTGSSPIIL
ncbi:MAG: chemotaxis protein CheD [Candidatus Hodarchaeales archaeon]|jgi:chemotaxis protein CheD